MQEQHMRLNGSRQEQGSNIHAPQMARDIDKEIAANIVAARERRKVGQAELGRRLGYKNNTSMWRIEAGLASITADLICRIAKALGTSEGEIWSVAAGQSDDLTPAGVNALLKALEATPTEASEVRAEAVKHAFRQGFTRDFVTNLLGEIRAERWKPSRSAHGQTVVKTGRHLRLVHSVPADRTRPCHPVG
jgi:transcriptional regulator with XRE-family HTH domain